MAIKSQEKSTLANLTLGLSTQARILFLPCRVLVSYATGLLLDGKRACLPKFSW
jgi:hypothetical protein